MGAAATASSTTRCSPRRCARRASRARRCSAACVAGRPNDGRARTWCCASRSRARSGSPTSASARRDWSSRSRCATARRPSRAASPTGSGATAPVDPLDSRRRRRRDRPLRVQRRAADADGRRGRQPLHVDAPGLDLPQDADHTADRRDDRTILRSDVLTRMRQGTHRRCVVPAGTPARDRPRGVRDRAAAGAAGLRDGD